MDNLNHLEEILHILGDYAYEIQTKNLHNVLEKTSEGKYRLYGFQAYYNDKVIVNWLTDPVRLRSPYHWIDLTESDLEFFYENPFILLFAANYYSLSTAAPVNIKAHFESMQVFAIGMYFLLVCLIFLRKKLKVEGLINYI